MEYLISQEEIEALPEDTQQRFVGIEQLCRQRYQSLVSGSDDWPFIQDTRLRYMGIVLAAAKEYDISPLNGMNLPRRKDYRDEDFQDFFGELQFYTAQLMFRAADANSRTSVVLQGATRARLHTLLHHLREQVKKLDLPPARIDQLLSRIDDFERELLKPKLTFVAVAVLSLYVVGVVADLGGSAQTVQTLITQVQQALGQAKEEQDKAAASRLLAADTALRLLAPPRPSETSAPPSQQHELDDDIPF